MSELSLTGKSISPIQQGSRSLSARSRSSTQDSRRMRSTNSSLNSETKGRRPRSSLAPAFPKSKQLRSSPRQNHSGSHSSTDFLSLFESPRNHGNKTTGSTRSSYSYIDDERYTATSEHSQINVRVRKSAPSDEGNERNRTRMPQKTHNTHQKDATELVDQPFTNIRGSFEVAAPQYAKHESQSSVQSKSNSPVNPENILDKREKSAVQIQTWYRRHSQRKKASEAALKRLMQQKKVEIETNINEDKKRTRQRSEDEKRKQRKERERDERRKAIAELRKSRELQDKEYKSIVEKEMSLITEKKKAKKVKNREGPNLTKTPSKSQSDAVKDVEEKIERLFAETKANIEDLTERKSVSSTESIPEEISETPGISTAQSQGLLESLLETIQQLEAEPEQLTKTSSSNKYDEKLSWIDQMQADHHSITSNTKSALSGAGDSVDGAKIETPSDSDVILTKAKLTNLMDFLDKVDKRDEEYEAAKSEVSKVTNTTAAETESQKVAELVEAEKVASNVTSELLQLRLEVNEKSRSVDMLKKALQQQRELSLRQVQDQEKELNQRLKMQKEQYEATIKRHLSFIDQLIDDKKVLNEKCERVVLEMKEAESKYRKKIKEIQEAHGVEMKKQKEIFSAAEKMRREKWIEEKTRTIKEMTVKGLEPEIQKLIARHKQEVKKIKAIHEAELLQSDERAGQRYIRQTEELREHLEREKETACNREREMARQRYEKQLEQEEMALQQQRRRLYAEVADEKERLNEQAARQRADIDKLKEQLQNQNSLATSALTEEYKKSSVEAERRHQVEIETLKERIELEKQAWQETYIKKQEAFILQKERELKEAVRRDRDTEIETVIDQLEKDSRMQREQTEKTSENRIKRIREKYESELKEIEILERQTQEKYNNLKVQYSDIEAENMRLKSTITQKDQEITDVKKIKTKLVEERGNVTDIIREEFAERLVHTEEENKRMKNEIAQMRARQRLELDRVNKEKEEELSEVHKRVRAAIVKKEEAVANIKEQYEAAVKRADHLEGLLETQRKQLLSVKK